LESDIEVFVDLREYSEPGTYKAQVQIRKQGSATDTDTLVITVDPQEISIYLDLKMSKTVPLSPVFQGFLESGYEMVFYSLDPGQVVIDGPVSIVSGIAELPTKNIDLRNRNTDFSERVAVVNPNPLLDIRGDGYTEFFGHIGELIMMRSFDDIPIAVSGLGAGLTAEMEINKGSVRFEGTQLLLEALVPSLNMLSVDCSGISDPGTYTLPLNVEVPPGLILSRHEPEEIRITIHGTESE
jgi:YbbR domain-containing protein